MSAFSAPAALAKAACNNGGPGVAGTADIALVQAVSVATNGNYVDHLTVTNYGPCNVPNAGLTAMLPGGLIGYSSNPNSWTCSADLATGKTVSCYETSTIGVPGTADIYLEYAPASGLINACAATFDVVGSLVNCPSSNGVVTDPNTANNTSTVAAGVVGPGGTLIYGPGGDPKPINGFDHTTSVTLAAGGLVNIYQATGCPVGIPGCFLGTVTVNTSASGSKTFTFTFFASLTTKSLSQITIWFSSGNGFTALTSCSGKHATDPCVQSRSKSGTGADTIYTITVVGTQDSGWTAD